ncbi:MAG TPA: ferrochelatase [Terriglobales bacterium]|nr:ferrochelatase [Terriglobales bacterium]
MTACPLGFAGQCYCANRVSSFAAAEPAKTAVLLLAHGSPEAPDQVPDFLSYVTGGRPLPPPVVEEIRHRYSLIGFSPLPCWTLLQADQLSQSLKMPVFVGMRNWKPFIGDTVKAIARQKYARVIAICLAPQNSRTSVGLYRSAVSGDGNLPFEMDFVEQWHDQPLLAKAFAEKLRAGWEKASAENGAKLPVIFTAHSVPQRTITEGDPYERQSKETAELVAKEADLTAEDWTFAFQSQGMSGGPWIGPTVEETIRNLEAKGHRGVFLHPIGFLCDHVEVLYDIDIAFKQFAEKQGMRLWRAESLNGSKTLTAALADVVRSRVKALGI